MNKLKNTTKQFADTLGQIPRCDLCTSILNINSIDYTKNNNLYARRIIHEICSWVYAKGEYAQIWLYMGIRYIGFHSCIHIVTFPTTP
jgi:hypothetical protein